MEKIKMNNPTYYYLELINSILADVYESKYDAIYGLRCANLILKGFSKHINDIMRSYPESGSITNVLEIYLSVSIIYDIYQKEHGSVNGIIHGDVDFPAMPNGWTIIELSYSRSEDKWYITVNSEENGYNILVENTNYFIALTEVVKKIYDWKIEKEIDKLKLESKK